MGRKTSDEESEMKTGRRLRSISEEKRCTERGCGMTKYTTQHERKSRDRKESPQARGKHSKPSLIPVPKEKPEKADNRSVQQRERKCCSSSKLTCVSTKPNMRYEDFESKLKMLEEKEKSIAQYYLKVEDLIRKLTESEQKENGKPLKRKPSRNTAARKMTSDTQVISTYKHKTNNDILADLENNVQQISKIWLQASTDLSSTLKNLKSNPSLDPMEFELERVRIQLAIKQTKSLTLVKTRDILAEARRLFRHREMIRMELENIVNFERLNHERCDYAIEESSKSLEEKETSTSFESDSKQRIHGTGDSPKESDVDSQGVSTNSNEDSERERVATPGTEDECVPQGAKNREDSSSEEKENLTDKKVKKLTKLDKPSHASPKGTSSVETWATEMTRKNETIATLNNKIFELQKTCNEQSHKCNQLEVALSQFSEKIQWNHVLWKQISKLKEQIKGLQQSNKQLESQKREMECKITKLDLELDRLLKLNHFLNQRKHLLNAQEDAGKECQNGERRGVENSCKIKNEKCFKESENEVDDRILAEKQNAINQLKTVLNVMKSQENFAQQQISLFQNKIEELEKNTKA